MALRKSVQIFRAAPGRAARHCNMLAPPPPQRGCVHTAGKCIRIKYFWANVK